MKKLFMTCALITSASIVSFAQTKEVSTTTSMEAPAAATSRAPQAQPKQSIIEQLATRKAKTYQSQYGLTAEQYQKVYDVEYDYARQEHEIKISGGQPGPGQVYQMQLGHDYKMKNIMTPAQYTKYEATTPRPTMPGAEQKQSGPAKR
jgi:hypothetical protein